MGTLYWQFNDCWPVISWSSIDHGGNWKALHYLARHFFGPVLVSMRDLDGKVEVHIINDQHQGHDAELNIQLFNFDGEQLFKESFDFEIRPFSSNIVQTLDKDDLLGGRDTSELVLRVELRSAGDLLSKSHLFFKRPKELNIPIPDHDHDVKQVNDKYEITIRSNSFLCQLHLRSSKVRGVFSDNYFDMLPNEIVVIEFDPYDSQHIEGSDIKIRTLHEMMN